MRKKIEQIIRNATEESAVNNEAVYRGQLFRMNVDDASAAVNQALGRDATRLLVAARDNHVEIVKMLLDAGADVNHASGRKVTPLLAAAQDNRVEIVEMLIEAKAAVNKSDIGGYTPLLIAAQEGYVKIVGMLLDADANINQAKINGDTALICAAGCAIHKPNHPEVHNRHAPVVQRLLADERINPAITNNYGNTALMVAAKKGHANIVQILLADGRIDPNIANNEGDTAYNMANKNGYVNVMNLLQAFQIKEPAPAAEPNVVASSAYGIWGLSQTATKTGNRGASVDDVKMAIKRP